MKEILVKINMVWFRPSSIRVIHDECSEVRKKFSSFSWFLGFRQKFTTKIFLVRSAIDKIVMMLRNIRRGEKVPIGFGFCHSSWNVTERGWWIEKGWPDSIATAAPVTFHFSFHFFFLNFVSSSNNRWMINEWPPFVCDVERESKMHVNNVNFESQSLSLSLCFSVHACVPVLLSFCVSVFPSLCFAMTHSLTLSFVLICMYHSFFVCAYLSLFP